MHKKSLMAKMGIFCHQALLMERYSSQVMNGLFTLFHIGTPDYDSAVLSGASQCERLDESGLHLVKGEPDTRSGAVYWSVMLPEQKI